MSQHSGYRAGLVTEYAFCLETDQPGRARAVLAELERTGGVPDGLIEDTADRTPRETAVPKRARASREN